MGKIRVGVLRGGPSSEYDVSLRSGAAVLHALSDSNYDTRDILIDKNGQWHFRGLPKEPADILPHLDVAFLALHGNYGEDGQVQRLLDHFAVPYTGSRPYSSACAMNKELAKKIVGELGVITPKHRILEVSPTLRDDMIDVLRFMSLPLIVKPVRNGSSVGLTLARTPEMFAEGVRKAFEHGHQVLVEEYIEGKEATCGVIENFRGEELYALLPVEIIPDHPEGLFDYQAKYSGKSKELCPGSFSYEENRELERLARTVHKGLDLSHYSRSDFIVSPRGIYFLEANTLPGLTTESLLPKSITAIGSSLSEFLHHVITLARRA